jgi:hypothetical protein
MLPDDLILLLDYPDDRAFAARDKGEKAWMLCLAAFLAVGRHLMPCNNEVTRLQVRHLDLAKPYQRRQYDICKGLERCQTVRMTHYTEGWVRVAIRCALLKERR